MVFTEHIFLRYSKNNTNKSLKWTIFDAAKLVIEPLFGQSKSNQDYTVVGTQGFDLWDQVLSAFIKFNFLEEGLILFIDVASDDNRANFTDLRAHWDHTLAYQIGMNKNLKFKKNNAFIISEFTSTKGTNTFNGKFYRGNELSENFYTKTRYDYFSYEGRRMGAHSGTSSEDLYFLFGVNMKTYSFFISYNSEIHGIKHMEYPELKSEIAFGYQKSFSNRISINMFFEYEEINNFEFIQVVNQSAGLFGWGLAIHLKNKMKKTILLLLTLFFSNENLVSQASEIPKSKKIDYFRAFKTNLFQSYKLNFQNVFSATFFKRHYINTNLPNFENLNGMYLQKGYGSMTSVLYQVRLRNIYFSFEPNLVKRNNLALYLPKKQTLSQN